MKALGDDSIVMTFPGGRGIDWCRLLFGMVAHFPSCHHCHPHQSNSLPAFAIIPNNTFSPLFETFWPFFCVCLTHQRMLDKQWKWVLHVASIQRVPQHGKPITQINQGGRRGRVIICFSGCLVVANHLGVGGAIRSWIREINYLCLALSSELYHVANCRKRARIERSNYFTNLILKCWYHNCYIW